MKVVVLGDASSSHTIKWVNSLKQNGVEIKLLSLSAGGQGIPTMDVECHHLLQSKKLRSLQSVLGKLGYLLTVFEIRRLIRIYKPDILHAHYATSYGLLARLSGFAPYLVSMWGSDILVFPNANPFNRMLLGWILKGAQRVFSTSEYMADRCARLYNLRPTVIPFGIDTVIFHPETDPERHEHSHLVIGTAKGLESIYGIDVLIRAMALAKMRSAIPLKLRIAGDGSQRAGLLKLAHSLHLSDDVEFVGRLDPQQIPAFLRSLDIFANLSRRESFGVSVLEASSCAVAVLVSDIEGLKEVYVESTTGLSCEVDNAEDTASKLLRLIGEPALRATLGCQGRQFVQDKYQWSGNVNKMLSEYRAIRFPA